MKQSRAHTISSGVLSKLLPKGIKPEQKAGKKRFRKFATALVQTLKIDPYSAEEYKATEHFKQKTKVNIENLCRLITKHNDFDVPKVNDDLFDKM